VGAESEYCEPKLSALLATPVPVFLLIIDQIDSMASHDHHEIEGIIFSLMGAIPLLTTV